MKATRKVSMVTMLGCSESLLRERSNTFLSSSEDYVSGQMGSSQDPQGLPRKPSVL